MFILNDRVDYMGSVKKNSSVKENSKIKKIAYRYSVIDENLIKSNLYSQYVYPVMHTYNYIFSWEIINCTVLVERFQVGAGGFAIIRIF